MRATIVLPLGSRTASTQSARTRPVIARAASSAGTSLVVVESPSKAATISKYLGPGFTVLASYGHVRDLASKEGAVEPATWDMRWETLPRAAPRLTAIREALSDAKVTRLVLATDPDREGEAIAWHLLEVLRPQLRRAGLSVGRATFTEVTQAAVTAAVAAPRELCTELVDAYKARRALDFLVGYTLSPVLWRKLPGAKSAGRVQSVALRLIVERAHAIECFTPEHYWTVDGAVKAPCGTLIPASLVSLDGTAVGKFKAPEAAQAAVDLLLAEGHAASVQSLTNSNHSRSPPAPFTTSTLQQAASTVLGMGASATMSVAQRLFEGASIGRGLITYHRTDSPSIAPDAAKELRGAARKMYGAKSIPATPRVYTSKAKNAQEAHEAIRPVDPHLTPAALAREGKIEPQEVALYALIWRRTVASQMSDCLRERTQVDVHCGTKGGSKKEPASAILRLKGSRVVEPGWLAAMRDPLAWPAKVAQPQETPPDEPPSSGGEGASDDVAGDGDGDTILPPLTRGDRVVVVSAASTPHATSPPPRHTEGTLVKDMEACGVGRPSTYAPTIQVLLARGYVQKLSNRRLAPTPLGWVVASYLQAYFPPYVDAAFTARMEEQLDEVASGAQGWKSPLTQFWQPFTEAIDSAMTISQRDVIDELDVRLSPVLFKDGLRSCPACGTGKLGVKLSRSGGAFLGCSNHSTETKCTYAAPLFDGGETSGETQVLFPKDLGTHPDSGHLVSLHTGPWGLYVQLNDPALKTPRRASVPKALPADAVTLDHALDLLALPMMLGTHPDDGAPVSLRAGPFGLYVAHGEPAILRASLPASVMASLEGSPANVTLELALELLAKKALNPGRRGRAGAKPVAAAPKKAVKKTAKAAAKPASKMEAKAVAKAKKTEAVSPSEAAPKKLNSYMRFCAEQRKIGPASAAELGARWRGLSDTQKTQFASAP